MFRGPMERHHLKRKDEGLYLLSCFDSNRKPTCPAGLSTVAYSEIFLSVRSQQPYIGNII